MRRFLTPTWLLRHAVMLLAVAVCLVLGWWQLSRARGGNMLSYGYAVEWPVFAAFAVGIWLRELRLVVRADRPEPVPVRAEPVDPLLTTVPVPARGGSDAAVGQDELGAYNAYLSWLAEDPSRRPADYRR